MTLLGETIRELHAHALKGEDVNFVQTRNQIGTWADFVKIAYFEYNSGYGRTEINSNLQIVGDNWWLERGEYDGSEWWEFKTLPNKIEKGKPLKKIKGEEYD